MGARASTRKKDKARSDAIDRQIEKESRSCRRVNMLLLGTDPERLMIVKRMKIQHGLTNDELMRYRITIYRNILDSAQALVRAIRDMGIEYADPMNQVKADHILDYHIQHSPSFIFSSEVAEDIHQIWQDPILPKVMDRRNEFWLGESVEYFFEEILRIGSPDYLPTDDDVLRARDNPSQVIEIRLTFDALQVTIIDTGKRHSHAKWMHYFMDVPYIIFCVSLSDYDQVLREYDCQNPLNESFIVFESIANFRGFARASVILFLTNTDVFKDKLSKVPLKRYFSDYTGGADVDEAIEYIQSRFMQVNRARLPTYFIRHQATNTTTPQSIFGIVKDTILEDASEDIRQSSSCSATIWALRLRRMISFTGPQTTSRGVF